MLRTSELYERQRTLDLYTPSHVIIVGAGGTGAWSAIFLAMSGVPQLTLMDFDRMSENNRNRLPFKKSDIGKLKVEVVRDFIQAIRPECSIEIENKADSFTLELVDKAEFLFDCTDRIDTQRFLYKWCQEHDTTYVRTGYDGTHVTCGLPPPAWSTTDEIQVGYTTPPSWVVPAAMVALMSVEKAMYNNDFTFSGDINQIVAGESPRRRTPFSPTRIRSTSYEDDYGEAEARHDRQADCQGNGMTWRDCVFCDDAEDCDWLISRDDD